MFKLRRSSALVPLLVAGLTWNSAQSLAQAPAPSRSPATTTITSERMTVQNKERRAIFEGEVVLTKGNLVVRSDVMVVLYRSTGEKGQDVVAQGNQQQEEAQAGHLAVSRIEATGQVRIEQDEGRATCRKAVYYQDERKIVLTGDPVAWQRGNRVTGRQITMYLDQERTVVEGDSMVMLQEVE